MSGGEDEGEKPHDPSQKRLDDARRRGEIPRSQDLTTAATYGGFLLALAISGPHMVEGLGAVGLALIGRPDRFAAELASGGFGFMAPLMAELALSVLALFALPLLGAVLSVSLQRGWIATPENLMPKLSRISPMVALRRRFGLDGLVEFGKSVAKMMIVSALLTLFLGRRRDDLMATVDLPPGVAVDWLGRQILDFIALVTLIAVIFGGADYLWQRLRHIARNRMSRQEMLDEHKDAEGDPHVKAERRQKAQALALNQMLADVGTADVIVVNPTHYAVALKWDRARRRAPVCVAKGVDEIAARIRERAAEAGVPIHQDPPTARALHASLQVGDEIRHEHYRAVAAAIRFAEAMRKRAKAARR